MPLNVNQLKQINFSNTGDSLQATIHILRGNIQDRETEKHIVVIINKLLSNSKSRRTGLEIMNALIEYFSNDVLTENIAYWSSNCAMPHSQDSSKEIKLKTVEKIIKNMGAIESFNKKFISDYLSDTVKACLIYNSNAEKSASLRCLSQCMKHYPSWFGNHKEKIELFLVKFLESGLESGVEDAALAFHFFQQTGSGGVDGINYINNFRNNLKKLCATVQFWYNSFFENIHEVDNSEKIESEIFEFSPISDGQKFLEGTASRIINCLCFIKTMISRGFPVEKQIVPKYIIDVVIRGLSTHICLSEENISLEKTRQSLLLNKIHLQLFQVLRVFIIGNQSSALPFSYVINKAIINVLKRTSNCTCYVNDTSYKTNAYKTLNCWLSVSKNINNRRLQEMLMPLLLKDIRPIKKKIALNLSSGKKKSKSAQSFTSDNITDTPDSKYVLNEDSCIYALNVLRDIFSRYPVTLNQQLLEEVVSLVVKTLFDIQSNRVATPYTSVYCQLKLYEVLISFMKQEQKILLPIHLVASILQKGLSNVDYRISQISRDGLELLETVCQPVCGSLGVGATETHSRQNSEPRKINSEVDNFAEEICNESVARKVEVREISVDNDESEINVEFPQAVSDIEKDDNKVEENGENVSKKEITIITNIVLSNANDSQDYVDGDFADTKQFGKEKVSVSESSIRARSSSEEPPTKKKKDDDSLENMFSSFQDVIQ